MLCKTKTFCAKIAPVQIFKEFVKPYVLNYYDVNEFKKYLCLFKVACRVRVTYLKE